MTRLEDLDDDCLLEVLDRLPADQLFKMLRVNSRLRRLAGDKMRVKIKALNVMSFDKRYAHFNESRQYFADCAHLGSISPNQEVLLGQITKQGCYSEENLFSLLPKLAGLKAIDFMTEEVSCVELDELVRNCPELECIKLGWLWFEEKDWQLFLDRIGEKIVHFTKHWFEESRKRYNLMDEEDLLKIIVAKCVNIKRLDWFGESPVPSSLVKKLPKNCWVRLGSDFTGNVFEDVVDEWFCYAVDWSSFGRRVDRLSLLRFTEFKHDDDDSVVGVNFAGLKTLDFRELPYTTEYQYHTQLVNCLVASRFPRLEECCFSITGGLTEEDFDALFQRITSVKKLSILCNSNTGSRPRMPGASILKLENLETIVFGFRREPNDWHFQILLQQLEQYTYEIRSLKKFTVSMWSYSKGDLRETAIGKFERLKAKQTRVQVELLL